MRIAGMEWETEALAKKLLRYEHLFNSTGGGITISGGEPLLQADFCCELLELLRGRIHTAIETSGFASSEDFAVQQRAAPEHSAHQRGLHRGARGN